jgi:predicted RNA binding protein YcfA (HicA-like mRNA interferase family)
VPDGERVSARENLLTAAELVRIFERGGWKVVRQKRPHQRLEHPDRPCNAITIGIRAQGDLPEAPLQAILRRAGLSCEEFEALRSR